MTPASVHAAAADAPRLADAFWSEAATLDAFIDGAVKNVELWQTTVRLARAGEGALAAVRTIPHGRRLLALVEDWCGDAIFTVPFAQRLAEGDARLALRVVRRDEHPSLMDAHLTGTSRSIPVVIAYDEEGRERGWWGPRPSPLQTWVMTEGLAMDKAERYKAIRTWYARDRGATTVAEMVTLLAR